MSKIVVRAAAQDDIEALKLILNDASRFKTSKQDDAWGSIWTDEDVAEALSFGNTNIVTLNGEAIGCVDLIWDDPYNWGEVLGSDGKAGYLHRLAVISEFRGQGLGEKIIDWVAERVRANNRQYIRLDCHADNHGLCSYYEGLGFEPVDNYMSNNKAFYQKSVIKT